MKSTICNIPFPDAAINPASGYVSLVAIGIALATGIYNIRGRMVINAGANNNGIIALPNFAAVAQGESADTTAAVIASLSGGNVGFFAGGGGSQSAQSGDINQLAPLSLSPSWTGDNLEYYFTAKVNVTTAGNFTWALGMQNSNGSIVIPEIEIAEVEAYPSTAIPT